MSRPADRFKDYLYPLFRQFINEPESIRTCRKTIRTAQPYICFVFLDTDSMPTATNIRLSRSYSDTLFRHRKLRQFEPHVLHEGSLYSDAQREKPIPRSFTLDAPISITDGSFPSVEQTVSVVAALDPDHQREKPVARSFTLNAPIGVIDKSIPSAEQRVSFDVSCDFKMQEKEGTTNSYILENQFGHCIHKTMNEDKKCDSYNISLYISEPCRYDHNIFRHETGCRILRFHRYNRRVTS